MTRFYAVLLLVFVLGLILALYPWVEWLTSVMSRDMAVHVEKIVLKLGEALVIAPVLAIAVDRAAKLQLLKEFGENISLHIMGRFLPRELRDHLEQYLTAQFVRRDWEITYTIEEWQGQSEFVKLTTLSQYEIENCSNDKADYEFEYQVDDSWYPNIGSSEIVRTGMSNPKTHGQLQDFRGDRLKSKIRKAKGGRQFSEKVEILPASVANGKYVFIAESVECFHKGYKENFTAYHPVLNTTLTVYYPAEKLDVEVSLSFAGADALEQTEIKGGTRWYIKRPILPGQSFFAVWKDKAKATANAQAAEPETSTAAVPAAAKPSAAGTSPAASA